MNLKKKRPFIDFYNKHNIIPTSNKSSIKKLINTRNYLYTNLGIPIKFIKDRTVIEFGPGGGWNAIATSAFKPKEYCFVDGSKKSISEIKVKVKNKKINALNISLIKKDIFNLKLKKKFDIAIAEGMIPNQQKPKKMLKIISSSVKKGGILIISLQTGVSLLSEFCRRILIIKVFQKFNSFDERLKNAVKIYENHLKTLKFASRPTQDWVLDVVFNKQTDYDKVIFGIDAAMKVLKEEMNIYNIYPKFNFDGTWYKTVENNDNHQNKLFMDQYHKFSINFLDFREEFKMQNLSAKKSKYIEKLCAQACILQNKMIEKESYEKIKSFVKILDKIKSNLPKNFQKTKKSIENYNKDIFRYINDENPNKLFKEFRHWWGRGAQYSSFIKK